MKATGKEFDLVEFNFKDYFRIFKILKFNFLISSEHQKKYIIKRPLHMPILSRCNYQKSSNLKLHEPLPQTVTGVTEVRRRGFQKRVCRLAPRMRQY